MRRLLSNMPPVRWLRTLGYYPAGVRLSPTARVFARRAQVELARGTRIGSRARIDLAGGGRFVTGAQVWLNYDVEVESSTAITIGAGTTIQRRCMLNGTVTIGEGCIFAPNVFVSSGSHVFRHDPRLPIREQERLAGGAPDRPVSIGDDCWLGVNAVVMPGVSIGRGAIVGANAVVTRDVAPYAIVAGSPARVIGNRLDGQRTDSGARVDRAERRG
jgi:acetyltransferase-like isoleucine patch superfamily enzyme